MLHWGGLCVRWVWGRMYGVHGTRRFDGFVGRGRGASGVHCGGVSYLRSCVPSSAGLSGAMIVRHLARKQLTINN